MATENGQEVFVNVRRIKESVSGKTACAIPDWFVREGPGLEVINLKYSLKLEIKRNDWLLADTQAANHCALF